MGVRFTKYQVGDRVRVNVPGEGSHGLEGTIKGRAALSDSYDWLVSLPKENLVYREDELMPVEDDDASV